MTDDELLGLLREAAAAVRTSLDTVEDWGLSGRKQGQYSLDVAADTAALEVSAIDSFGSVTDAPERSLTFVARQQVSLAQVLAGEEQLCDVLDRCLGVSRFLLEQSPSWGV